jgi:hypothetical protein
VFLSVLQEVTQYNMVHHTQHTRNKVAKLFFQGFSSYMIGKQLAKEKVVVSGRTIRDWVTRLEQNPDQYYAGRRYKHSGNTTANRKGAPPLSTHDRLRIRGFARQKKGLRALAKTLPAGLKASRSTLRRESVKEGMVPLHRSHKPLLTRATKRKRLTFSVDTLNFNWLSVVFTDIVTVTQGAGINTHNDIVWDYKGTKVKPNPTTKKPMSESFFAAITSEGGVTLEPCKATPKAIDTQRLLDNFLPRVEHKVGHDFTLTTLAIGRQTARSSTCRKTCQISSLHSNIRATALTSTSRRILFLNWKLWSMKRSHAHARARNSLLPFMRLGQRSPQKRRLRLCTRLCNNASKTVSKRKAA